ncbi:DUF6941 family protein [Nitrobacter sp.]|uniref:DUF6941 family protein n=1 Tax=Nitrobacter sp. TaxID=29420 RepID=UPI0029CAB5DE|nr:hypothetical protein [Nitrobacter sp.]
MTPKRCPTPFGYAIFCDEVRFEATGKQIFIGVYNQEMIIAAEFPVQLRLITVVTNFSERPSESKDDITFDVTYTGIEKPVATMMVARSELDKVEPPPPDTSDEYGYDPIMGVGGVLSIADLNLPAPGKLTVVATRGEDRVILGRLRISKGPVPPPLVLQPNG